MRLAETVMVTSDQAFADKVLDDRTVVVVAAVEVAAVAAVEVALVEEEESVRYPLGVILIKACVVINNSNKQTTNKQTTH